MKAFATFNYIQEIELDIEDAKMGSHSGDCESDVKYLMQIPYIKSQLDEIDPEKLKQELHDYGAWDDEELSNHEDNKMRILWESCNLIVEDLYDNFRRRAI
jgi:hypothetical protein